MAEFEKSVRTPATAPELMKSFMAPSPGLAQAASKLTASITEMAQGAVERAHKASNGWTLRRLLGRD